MILLEFTRAFRIENSHLPWWYQFPEHWGYPLQTLVCLALLWWWRGHYPKFTKAGIRFRFLMGLIGIAIWLIPPFVHHLTQIGDSINWLKKIGFQDRSEGFNPNVFDPSTQPIAHVLTITFRLIRLVVVVALVEEIFWRGFLMRYLIQGAQDWSSAKVGQFSHFSFWITALLFASVHNGP